LTCLFETGRATEADKETSMASPGFEKTEAQVLEPTTEGWSCRNPGGFYMAHDDWQLIVAKALEYVRKEQLDAAVIQITIDHSSTFSEHVDLHTTFRELVQSVDKQREEDIVARTEGTTMSKPEKNSLAHPTKTSP